ncbi:YEY2 [Candida pseudojiufengensis]|uniref:YEY2 n=1 Tax=Candida pseudojiufengensis TaxID=497109 RepID=UPI002224CE3E|nr:YEY2 [Candida pseudojiufengensis]KAI5962985.1 YEY2 [Candida pseudojiufengensis]
MAVINFFKGHPSTQLLPSKLIADTYSKVLINNSDYLDYDNDPNNQHPLAYGTDSGNLDIRNTISNWVNSKYRSNYLTPDLINLTAGASYGVANILTSTTLPSITKKAFIVTPTYFLINSSFFDVGLGDDLIAINETAGEEYDIDIQKLEEDLQKYGEEDQASKNIIKDPRGERKIYQFVLYMVPTFSNPGGITYSRKTREKLIQLARKYDMLIISDDVYEYLDYSNVETVVEPIPKLNQLDQESITNKYGNTISNATFSKIIAPGLRVGWQESPTPHLVHQLSVTGANKSGGTPSQLSTFIVNDLIKSGQLDEIILRFKGIYKDRTEVLKESVKKYLPEGTQVYGGDGGYFLWVKLPDYVDNQKVIKEVQKKGVILAGGEHFEVLGESNKHDWGKSCSRLCISFLTSEEIEQGIKLWGETIHEVSNRDKTFNGH